MVKVLLPQSLTVLFPGAPRETEVEAGTVCDVIERLHERWPGMRTRLVDVGPRLRAHIHVAVNGELADLDAPVRPGSVVRIVPSITGG